MLQKDLTKKLLILSAKDETKMLLLKEIRTEIATEISRGPIFVLVSNKVIKTPSAMNTI